MAFGRATPAVRVRRSGERGFEDFGWTDNWMTFSFGGYHNREWMNFGPLRVIVENHIQPHSGFPSHSHRGVDVAGVTLESGDGVGITGVEQLEFVFRGNTELLLFDLGMGAPLIWR